MSTEDSNSSANRRGAALQVHLLGIVDFDAALALQERLVYELTGRSDQQGALLLCEHPPLITIGREGSRGHIQAEDRELQARRVPVRRLGRGGGTFMHMPGQLAIYPVLPLSRMDVSVMEFRERLEDAVVDVCEELMVPAERQADKPGVFCHHGQVAHTGIAVKRWVTCHGLYLNVNLDLNWLKLVGSNSLATRPTTLAAQRTRVTEMSQVRESVVRHVATRFNYDHTNLYTSHPMLKRTYQTVAMRA
ncbi:lipoyl(octanoyl) transferase LipB [Thalassoroseus pseudoceratinae]|uniref:lipoyl(octanoyl) transferase LipB n=1 Tax=Thalassoroseus pseudoceratinae TaxID=2713176 RepID=UPI0014220D08|nr:lipoyl(octanoyl) transferase LipB [Thalassoroseus pseudoceratinae]